MYTPNSVIINAEGDYVVTFEDSEGVLMSDEMTFTKEEVIDSTYLMYKDYRVLLITKWDGMDGTLNVLSLRALATWNLENSGVNLINEFSMYDDEMIDKLTFAITQFYENPENAKAYLDEKTLINIATEAGILAAQQ